MKYVMDMQDIHEMLYSMERRGVMDIQDVVDANHSTTTCRVSS